MRAPPPVEVETAPGPAWRTVGSLLVAVAVAVPVAWTLPRVGLPEPFALAAGVLAFALAWWASCRDVRHRACTLRWDGEDWTLARGRALDARGDARLMLDLGPWMLVHFMPHPTGERRFGAGRWLPLALQGDPARWSALRGALWMWRAAAERSI